MADTYKKVDGWATFCIWGGVAVAVLGTIVGVFLVFLMTALSWLPSHGTTPKPWTYTLWLVTMVFGPLVYGVGLIILGHRLKELRPWTLPMLFVLNGTAVLAIIWVLVYFHRT